MCVTVCVGILALPMASTARSLLIYMGIEGADFSVAHASSLRSHEEEEPPVLEDPDSLANLDLREAVQIMVCHQLGLVLEEKEVMEIVAFLESLTGTYEGKRLESDNAPYPEGTPLPDPPDACQP